MARILLNPHAGAGAAARLLAPLREWAQAHPGQASVHEASTLADAHELLQACAPGERVLVVGGDGTLHQWLAPIVERRLTLALLSAGSGNDQARALDLAAPAELGARLAHLLTAPAQAQDSGLLTWTDGHGDHHRVRFHSSLSVGLDARIARSAQTGPRYWRGQARYVRASLLEIARLRHHHARIWLDGQAVHQGPVLLAATLNTPTFGAGMPAAPMARTDDGQLQLLLAQAMGRWRALRLLPRLLAGQHLGDPGVQVLPYARARIDSPEGLALAADGEWLGVARRLVIEVQPQSLLAVRGPVASA